MKGLSSSDDTQSLVESLNFAQKVDRSLGLIRGAYERFGDRLVVANSLGKDSALSSGTLQSEYLLGYEDSL